MGGFAAMLKSMRPDLKLVVSLLFALSLIGNNQSAIVAASSYPTSAERSLGSIIGTVYDHKGQPLSGALVMVLREGAEQAIKEARTGADGKFFARVAAGRYTLRAIATGFSPAIFEAVQITPSAELIYRFNLEPTGQGRTVPEKRRDRDDTKWRLRAAQSRRSIFQVDETKDQTVAAVEGETVQPGDEDTAINNLNRTASARTPRPQGVIETFAFTSSNPLARNYIGTNFALAQSINDNLDLILAGQYASGGNALRMQRLQTTARWRVADHHRLNLSAGGIIMDHSTPFSNADGANMSTRTGRADLAQISLRALDEWTVREGVVVVLGMDYSRLSSSAGGAHSSSRDSLTPQLGVQYDVNARTRLRAAYTPGSELQGTNSIAQFEDNQIVFKEPAAQAAPVAYAGHQPLLERSQRMQIGVERLLGARSSVEATAFFDTVSDRGIGLMSLPVSSLTNEGSGDSLQTWSVVSQQGDTRGMRVLYARRLNSVLKASAGYSFGRGQSLAAGSFNEPAKLFRNGFFQTAAAQLDAHLPSRTQVRTVFRFSPGATVFAIDPFAGRLAVYDPSLSVYVTQELPTFGLPVQVEAVFDARNLLDTQTNASDESETLMSVGAMRRSLRGGISVRF